MYLIQTCVWLMWLFLLSGKKFSKDNKKTKLQWYYIIYNTSVYVSNINICQSSQSILVWIDE